MFRIGPKVGLSVLLLGGCGHASQPSHANSALAAEQGRTVRLESDLLRYEARITEIEARMALLEQEARGGRSTARPSETVRIGAGRAERVATAESSTDDDLDADYAATRSSERVPVLKLYGESRREPATEAELGPLPEPPPGVSMQLPVVALPGQAKGPDGDAEARETYRAALEQLRAQHYEAARAALEKFMVKHASHELADNAAYWLGEAHYAQRDYGRALESFELVVKRFPKGNKVPDALLKLAMCHRRLGDAERAESYLLRVRQEFPNSPAAHIATREGSS